MNVFFSDLITAMEDVDVSAQVRRGFAQRELGYYRSALRRKVGIMFVIVTNFPSIQNACFFGRLNSYLHRYEHFIATLPNYVISNVFLFHTPQRATQRSVAENR